MTLILKWESDECDMKTYLLSRSKLSELKKTVSCIQLVVQTAVIEYIINSLAFTH